MKWTNKTEKVFTAEKYLLDIAGLTPRSKLKQAFLNKKVSINGKIVSRADSFNPGDVIEVKTKELFSPHEAHIAPNEKISLKVIKETKDFLVVFKNPLMHSHPQHPDENDTVMNAVVAKYPECGKTFRKGKPLEGGLLHRLDFETSGCLVVARNQKTFDHLLKEWQEKTFEKTYLAVVSTHPKVKKEGCVTLWLSHRSKKTMQAHTHESENKKLKQWKTKTSFRVIKKFESGQALVLFRIFTGVTHQIRVTSAALGMPLTKDTLYLKGRTLKDIPYIEKLDPHTAKAFDHLEKRLIAQSLPHRDCFFLHALWLKSETLEEVFAAF